MKKVWKSMDYSLLLPLVILCVLGVIMVYSSSSIVAISRFDKPANFFFKRQLITLAAGTIVLIILVIIILVHLVIIIKKILNLFVIKCQY